MLEVYVRSGAGKGFQNFDSNPGKVGERDVRFRVINTELECPKLARSRQ